MHRSWRCRPEDVANARQLLLVDRRHAGRDLIAVWCVKEYRKRVSGLFGDRSLHYVRGSGALQQRACLTLLALCAQRGGELSIVVCVIRKEACGVAAYKRRLGKPLLAQQCVG